MRLTTSIVIITLLTGLALPVYAGSVPVSMSHDTFLVQRNAPWVSVGAGLEILEREVHVDKVSPGRMRATTLSGYLGIDLLHWFTVFSTLGRLEIDTIDIPGIDTIDIPGAAGDWDNDRRWSFGASANVWHINIEEPPILTGRLSIGLVGEYTQYDASGSGESLDWTEQAIAVPVSLFLPAERRKLSSVHGAAFFLGPIYSLIDGYYSTDGRRTDFDEEQEIGLLAGMDAFLARNLTVGGQIQCFEQVAANFSFRYHF